jgi:hypothetical protein
MRVKKFRDTVKIVLMPGLEVQISPDGTWMHFDGDKRSGVLRLESLAENGTICGGAIANWCEGVRTNPRFQL